MDKVSRRLRIILVLIIIMIVIFVANTMLSIKNKNMPISKNINSYNVKEESRILDNYYWNKAHPGPIIINSEQDYNNYIVSLDTQTSLNYTNNSYVVLSNYACSPITIYDYYRNGDTLVFKVRGPLKVEPECDWPSYQFYLAEVKKVDATGIDKIEYEEV